MKICKNKDLTPAIEAHIATMNNPTVGDVIGGKKTIIKEYPTLPSSLPNQIKTIGTRYDKLPSQLQQKIEFSFAKDLLGAMIDPITFPFAKLNNEKVTLSFKPATKADEDALASLIPEGITDVSQLPTSIPSYLVQVIPELKVNGATVKTGSPMRLGEEINFVTGIRFAGKGYVRTPRSYSVIAGSYLNVNVFAGSVSPVKLEKLQSKLEQTKTTLESANQANIASLTRDDILGDMFYAGGLGYYAQLLSLGHISGLKAKGYFQLEAGYGTVGYEPDIDYFFGLPRGIKTGGVTFDIPLIMVTANQEGDAEKARQFTQLVGGTLMSALEHITPEQMFASTDPNAPKPDAISAVKALQKASAAGQKIYQINQANMNQILPLLHHDREALNEIKRALNVGKDVTTHTDAVSIPGGWSGFGYIITDPVVGDGAYKISGGANGGRSNDMSDVNTALSFSFSTLSGASDGLNSSYGNLEYSREPALKRFAKMIAKAGKYLGGMGLVLDIIEVLRDKSLSVSSKAGRISTIMFGFLVGGVVGEAVGAAMFLVPGGAIVAALLVAMFIATLTIVILDFNLIYFSKHETKFTKRFFYV